MLDNCKERLKVPCYSLPVYMLLFHDLTYFMLHNLNFYLLKPFAET